MTAINVKSKNDTTVQSPTQIANQSFDQTFQVNVVEPVVYNPVTGALDRAVQSGNELPTSGNNPSTVLAYDVDGNLSTIIETINSVQYQTTLTYSSGILTNISSAVQL